MFVEKLMNQTNAPLLEKLLEFTAARHKLLAENIANASTPGYKQKDLSVNKFMQMLRDRAAMKASSAPGSVDFDDLSEKISHPRDGILFHDGNNRSMEQIFTDQAKNAMMHNMVIELLRKQYSTMEMALREKVS